MVRNRRERCLDVLPTALVVERTTERLGDVCAAPATADPAIELLDELVVEAYVQTHGHNLAHK
jgi:hypothetical protein